MKKRRTRKQKIGAKRQPLKMAVPSPIIKSQHTRLSQAKLASSGEKGEVIHVDHEALRAIKFDLAKTVMLSLLIFGLELSIYFWWN
jgi:hypothetical protein